MKIRRIQFNIDYVHILTFREEYKSAVIPFFGFDNLRYGIDNEGTHNESIRLIFKQENVAIQLRKDGAMFVFEGDVSDVKKQSGVMHTFWEIFDKIKNFSGFKKVTKHSITCHAVDIHKEEFIDTLMNDNPYSGKSPFGKLKEFSSIYEYGDKSKYHVVQVGNYTDKDIEKYDLSPFSTEHNIDLVSGIGLMCKTEIREMTDKTSYTKYKELLEESEKMIQKINI